VGLLRLTLDLTRRRPELFAKIGAVEVVKGAVAPPTPGTEAWWRAAVREAVYTLRERGLVQYVKGLRWSAGSARRVDNSTCAQLFRTAKNGVLSRLTPLFSFFGAPKNGVSSLPNAE